MRSAACILLACGLLPAGPRVEAVRTPNGGIQPQTGLKDGTLHLVYYAGESDKGDLFYVRSTDYGKSFSPALRVNSTPGSAIAVGNIRGAHLAVGRNGSVHVAWNGSSLALPKSPSGQPPMQYARLAPGTTAFEPERNLIHDAYGVDGGGSLAADESGNVFVFWHAPKPGMKGEENRRVWMAKSSDDGATFNKESVAFDSPIGACGCCGLKASVDSTGTIHVLFRAADQVVNRDIWMLTSKDRGGTFTATDISAWKIGACVMSSEAFADTLDGQLAAWESEKQVYFGKVDPKTGGVATPVAAPGTPNNRKYPALAVNRNGETLLAWTEGTAWKRGGTVAWRVFDKSGNVMSPENGGAPDFPVWGLVAAFARPNGDFVVLY